MLSSRHLVLLLYKYIISDELNYIYREVCILYTNLYILHTDILLYIHCLKYIYLCTTH